MNPPNRKMADLAKSWVIKGRGALEDCSQDIDVASAKSAIYNQCAEELLEIVMRNIANDLTQYDEDNKL